MTMATTTNERTKLTNKRMNDGTNERTNDGQSDHESEEKRMDWMKMERYQQVKKGEDIYKTIRSGVESRLSMFVAGLPMAAAVADDDDNLWCYNEMRRERERERESMVE